MAKTVARDRRHGQSGLSIAGTLDVALSPRGSSVTVAATAMATLSGAPAAGARSSNLRVRPPARASAPVVSRSTSRPATDQTRQFCAYWLRTQRAGAATITISAMWRTTMTCRAAHETPSSDLAHGVMCMCGPAHTLTGAKPHSFGSAAQGNGADVLIDVPQRSPPKRASSQRAGRALSDQLDQWFDNHTDRELNRQTSQLETIKLLATFSLAISATLVATSLQVDPIRGLDYIASCLLGAAFLLTIAVILADRSKTMDRKAAQDGFGPTWSASRKLRRVRYLTKQSVQFNEVVVVRSKIWTGVQMVASLASGAIATVSLLLPTT